MVVWRMHGHEAGSRRCGGCRSWDLSTFGEAGRRVSGMVRLAMHVADSEDTARRVVAAGAVQVAPPVRTPWADRNARVQTPEGMQLTLFTPE